MAQVTEEQIEKAWKTYHALGWGMGTYGKMRAALESVADDLRQQGIEEGKRIALEAAGRIASEMLAARANQLSPTSKGDGE